MHSNIDETMTNEDCKLFPILKGHWEIVSKLEQRFLVHNAAKGTDHSCGVDGNSVGVDWADTFKSVLLEELITISKPSEALNSH